MAIEAFTHCFHEFYQKLPQSTLLIYSMKILIEGTFLTPLILKARVQTFSWTVSVALTAAINEGVHLWKDIKPSKLQYITLTLQGVFVIHYGNERWTHFDSRSSTYKETSSMQHLCTNFLLYILFMYSLLCTFSGFVSSHLLFCGCKRKLLAEDLFIQPGSCSNFDDLGDVYSYMVFSETVTFMSHLICLSTWQQRSVWHWNFLNPGVQ